MSVSELFVYRLKTGYRILLNKGNGNFEAKMACFPHDIEGSIQPVRQNLN